MACATIFVGVDAHVDPRCDVGIAPYYNVTPKTIQLGVIVMKDAAIKPPLKGEVARR